MYPLNFCTFCPVTTQTLCLIGIICDRPKKVVHSFEEELVGLDGGHQGTIAVQSGCSFSIIYLTNGAENNENIPDSMENFVILKHH